MTGLDPRHTRDENGNGDETIFVPSRADDSIPAGAEAVARSTVAMPPSTVAIPLSITIPTTTNKTGAANQLQLLQPTQPPQLVLQPQPQLQQLLRGTLGEFEIRSEIQSVLSSLLLDVELSYQLNAQQREHQSQVRVQQQQQEFSIYLKDRRAKELFTKEETDQLTVEFQRELWSLSQTIGKLKQQNKDTHHQLAVANQELEQLQKNEQLQQLQQQERPAEGATIAANANANATGGKEIVLSSSATAATLHRQSPQPHDEEMERAMRLSAEAATASSTNQEEDDDELQRAIQASLEAAASQPPPLETMSPSLSTQEATNIMDEENDDATSTTDSKHLTEEQPEVKLDRDDGRATEETDQVESDVNDVGESDDKETAVEDDKTVPPGETEDDTSPDVLKTSVKPLAPANQTTPDKPHDEHNDGIENKSESGPTILTLPEEQQQHQQEELIEKEPPVVELIQEDDDNDPNDEQQQSQETPKPVSFGDLDIAMLRKITMYMDPEDIFNVAQVNVSLYSLVDILFAEDEVEQESNNDGIVTREDILLPPHPPVPTVVSPSSPQLAPLSSPISSTAAISTLVPSAFVETPTSAPPIPVAVAPVVVPGASFFGLFDRATATAPLTINTLDSSDLSSSQQQQQQYQQQRPAQMTNLVQSMAEKLTPKEISAIISMREQLKKTQQWLNEEQEENQVLKGKLDGVTQMTSYLTGKLIAVEASSRKNNQDEQKVTQQIASDQEVICFLDGRVQELETDNTNLDHQCTTANTKITETELRHAKKLQVLGDMLQFERERLQDSEKEWKHSKKVLIKEVKSCRAQLLGVHAERDGYREQNERLKRALQGLGGDG